MKRYLGVRGTQSSNIFASNRQVRKSHLCVRPIFKYTGRHKHHDTTVSTAEVTKGKSAIRSYTHSINAACLQFCRSSDRRLLSSSHLQRHLFMPITAISERFRGTFTPSLLCEVQTHPAGKYHRTAGQVMHNMTIPVFDGLTQANPQHHKMHRAQAERHGTKTDISTARRLRTLGEQDLEFGRSFDSLLEFDVLARCRGIQLSVSHNMRDPSHGIKQPKNTD
jgi:hypothetical protein